MDTHIQLHSLTDVFVFTTERTVMGNFSSSGLPYSLGRSMKRRMVGSISNIIYLIHSAILVVQPLRS